MIKIALIILLAFFAVAVLAYSDATVTEEAAVEKSGTYENYGVRIEPGEGSLDYIAWRELGSPMGRFGPFEFEKNTFLVFIKRSVFGEELSFVYTARYSVDTELYSLRLCVQDSETCWSGEGSSPDDAEGKLLNDAFYKTNKLGLRKGMESDPLFFLRSALLGAE